jgi:hypothetical protein
LFVRLQSSEEIPEKIDAETRFSAVLFFGYAHNRGA